MVYGVIVTFKSIKLLSIVKPVWYYNLPDDIQRYYLKISKCFSFKNEYNFDYYDSFDDSVMFFLDILYQAIITGNALPENLRRSISKNHCLNEPSLNDQYVFIKRFFNQKWCTYVFFIRILCLNNPFKEFIAFLKTFRVKVVCNPIPNQRSELQPAKKDHCLKSKPLVSIIIATLNREKHTKQLLKDLENQSYNNFEILIIDQSDIPYQDYTIDVKADLKVYEMKEKQVWTARNFGIKASKGDFLVFIDDDIRIKPNWLSNHLSLIENYKCDVSSGPFYDKAENIPEIYSPTISNQFCSGNSVVKKSVFKKVGLFDELFNKMRGGDGEFGARCVINNLYIINNPKAYCIDLKAVYGGFRDFGIWDAMRSANLLSPIPSPSILYYFRKYWGSKLTILSMLQRIPFSLNHYKLKRSKYNKIISLLIFITTIPLVLFRFTLSWNKATKILGRSN